MSTRMAGLELLGLEGWRLKSTGSPPVSGVAGLELVGLVGWELVGLVGWELVRLNSTGGPPVSGEEVALNPSLLAVTWSRS